MPDKNQIVYMLTPEDETKKLEQILYRRFHLSRKQLQQIKKGEHAWLDGHFVFLNTRGQSGQTMVVEILEDQEATVTGEQLPLNVLYEDTLFLAVNKPPGQVVHPNARYHSATLANAVVGYWEARGELRQFRAVSRIDRNTSGIVLIAKNRYAHQQLARLSAQQLVQKNYLGLIQGSFPVSTGEITAPIRVKPDSRVVREVHAEGREAKTLYKTLKQYARYSLVEFTLVTGRTHQIRVHCQSLGHPLLGDDLYGGSQELIARQALHCHSYCFTHPLSQETLSINAPLPDDMQVLVYAGND